MDKKNLFDQPNYQERVEVSRRVRTRYVGLGFEKVLEDTKHSLIQEGFDIIIEFSFHDFLHQRLDRNVNRCVILGACHLGLVNQLLQGEDRIRDSMLCNIIIEDAEDGKFVQVSIVDPSELGEAYGNEQLDQGH